MELAPQLRHLLHQDGWPLSAGVVRSVLWAALATDDLAHVEAGLHRVGGIVQQQGFPADAYPSFGHAVLRSVRVLHAGDWSSRLSADWVAYLTWLIAHLRIGAAAAESPVATSPPGRGGPGRRGCWSCQD